MNPLSSDERRALGLLLALLLIAAAARWIERPKSILGEVADVDIAALEAASRDAKAERAPSSSNGSRPGSSAARQNDGGTAANSGNTHTRGSTRSTREVASRTPDAVGASARIDPNRASADELMQLPGVGPALASRIIAARAQEPFRTVDELQRVPGIGPALVQRMADQVALPRGNSAPPERMERGGKQDAMTSPTRRTAGTGAAPIDINRATAAELEAVPGIGPALARRLLARRDSLGRFRSYDDVDAVTGVGPALLARIRAATVLR